MKRAVAFSFLLACAGVLLGDSPDPGQPSRGSGSLLQDLVGLTNGGFSAETVLVYAKAHRRELPPKVSSEDLLWLRKSGVSESVTRYMAAIDVRASDTGAEENVAYDADEAARYSAVSDSYSDRDYGSYPISSYDSYPVSSYDSYPVSSYDSYPVSYFNDYYPVYGAGYYPYPVYFFVNQRGFFGRFHGRGNGFRDHRGHGGHGGSGGRRFPHGDFDRTRGGHRGGFVDGRRGPVARPAFSRVSPAQGFRGPQGGVMRRGAPGYPAISRGGFAQGPRGPRGAVVRNGGSGRPAFSGGGGPSGRSFGGGSTGRSGSGGRATAGRPAGTRGR